MPPACFLSKVLLTYVFEKSFYHSFDSPFALFLICPLYLQYVAAVTNAIAFTIALLTWIENSKASRIELSGRRTQFALKV